jgi:hypothetical protein
MRKLNVIRLTLGGATIAVGAGCDEQKSVSSRQGIFLRTVRAGLYGGQTNETSYHLIANNGPDGSTT